MSKILTNTVKKTTFLASVLSAIIAVAIALAIVFGVKGYGVFNTNKTLDDATTLTVSMNQYVYLTELEEVEGVCENAFGDLNVSYEMKGEMTGDESEIVYVFKGDVDLTAVETALDTAFAEWQKDGKFITVAVNSEKAVEVLAKNYALRGVVAAVVMVAAVYVYAAIRFGIGKGVLAAIGTFYSIALTAAVVIITRIPVTTSISYVFGMAGMLGAVVSVLSLNKIKANEKAEGASEMQADELVASSLAINEIVPVACLTAIALVVLAIVAPANMKWFALGAFVGVVMATVVGMLLVPSMYIPVKVKADKQPKEGSYVGAKKTSTKEKKTFAKAAPVVEAPKAEVEEAPVEEVVEEPVEETPVEEVAEEPAEEAPVEETAEEVVEETPVEEVAETTEETTEENNEQA